MLLIMTKLIVMSIVFFISNILVGLEIDYTCLGETLMKHGQLPQINMS